MSLTCNLTSGWAIRDGQYDTSGFCGNQRFLSVYEKLPQSLHYPLPFLPIHHFLTAYLDAAPQPWALIHGLASCQNRSGKVPA
jgi:hypothetical protein